MLAYRHAFHAGNHGDVLKHVVWVHLLRHLNLKDKGYRVVDTHAGAGRYALDSPQARKRGEYLQGIGRLWDRHDAPPAVADYLRVVRRANPDGELRVYPGSPLIASWLMRPQDELRLFERHPADHAALAGLFAGRPGAPGSPTPNDAAAPRHAALIGQADGFAGLKSQLPPPTRRALVLIDPSYEGLGDYARVVDAVEEALQRLASAVTMIWYPVVAKPGAERMLRGLKRLAGDRWLHARLAVQRPDAAGFGLAGSGVFVVHPPFTLRSQLHAALPWLAEALAQFGGARGEVDAPGAAPAA